MLLSSFISPRCQFLGRTMPSELVFIMVHSRHTSNFSLAQQRGVAVTYMGLMGP